MNNICRMIFRAIHEGKWLHIEYRNKNENITSYWIGIKDMNVQARTLSADGLHLMKYSVTSLNIYIDSIINAEIVEGTYQERNEILINDIKDNPERYRSVFGNTYNLKILNYLHLVKLNNIRCQRYAEMVFQYLKHYNFVQE